MANINTQAHKAKLERCQEVLERIKFIREYDLQTYQQHAKGNTVQVQLGFYKVEQMNHNIKCVNRAINRYERIYKVWVAQLLSDAHEQPEPQHQS